MYVASFDTKALGSVRHLPIQRATAVVNGWDFPTKLLCVLQHFLVGIQSVLLISLHISIQYCKKFAYLKSEIG